MGSHTKFWFKLLVDAGLIDNSGKDFNSSGDRFLSGLESSATPDDVAEVLAYYLPAPKLSAPVPAPLIGLQPLVLIDFTYFHKTTDDDRDALADKVRRFNKKLTEEQS